MPIEFSTPQRETLTAIVDTFVASVAHDDDPDGFYAAKGSDVGADVAIEQYLLTHLPEEQVASMLQLIDAFSLFGITDQLQEAREEIVATLAGMSPEAAGAIAALKQLSVLFAYSLPGPDGRNPLWVGMEYPGPAQSPPSDARKKTLEVITPAGETTLEADVVVVGSGSGGGVAAALLAEAGKRVIILEAGGYHNESDFEQSELAAYQKLFLRVASFPPPTAWSVSPPAAPWAAAAPSTGPTRCSPPNTVRRKWATDFGLEDVDTPAFDEHLQAVFERIKCNDKVATPERPAQPIAGGGGQVRLLVSGGHTQHRPDEIRPHPDRV